MKSHTTFLLLVLSIGALLWTGCRAQMPAAVAADPPATQASTSALAVASATPAATDTVAPSATPSWTPTRPPTATPAPTATPTVIPLPTRLTEAGCCYGPFFLDGAVTFIDKPSDKEPAAFYAVSAAGRRARLAESRMGVFMNGGAYFRYEAEGRIVIERRKDKGQLIFSAWDDVENPSNIALSPDGEQVSWSVREMEGPYDERRTEVWRAALQDAEGEKVMSLFGGGLSAWLPDGRWLMSGRHAIEEEDRTLFVYDLESRQSVELFQALSFRSVSVSPDGQWVAFVVAFDPKPERNGLWLATTDGTQRMKVDFFGAFAWRDATHLYYMPYRESAPANEVWVFNVLKQTSVRLTDPALTPFKIAQNDFAFAPDGSGLAFVSAADLSIWWLPLPADLSALERSDRVKHCECDMP